MLRHVAADAFAGLEPAPVLARTSPRSPRIPRPSHEEAAGRPRTSRPGPRTHGFATRRDDGGQPRRRACPRRRGREAAPDGDPPGPPRHGLRARARQPVRPARRAGSTSCATATGCVAEGTTLGADDGVAIAAMLARRRGRARRAARPARAAHDRRRGGRARRRGRRSIPRSSPASVLLNLDSEEDGVADRSAARASEDHAGHARRAARAAAARRRGAAGHGLRRPRRALRRRHRGSAARTRSSCSRTRCAARARSAHRVARRRRQRATRSRATPSRSWPATACARRSRPPAAGRAADVRARPTRGCGSTVGPPEPDDAAWSAAVSARVLDLLALLPAGPLAMSAGLPRPRRDLVLGGRRADRAGRHARRPLSLSRSSDDDALPVVRGRIEAAARLAGAAHESLGSYPGVAARSGRRAARHRDARVTPRCSAPSPRSARPTAGSRPR